MSTVVRMRVAVVAGALALALFPAPAAQAETRVLDSCVATVSEGDGPALRPLAVLDPVVSVLAPLDPLNVLVPAFELAWRATPPIALPAAGPAGIAGDEIADAVIGRLGTIAVVGPVLDALTGPVRGLLASTCRITVTPAEQVRVDPAPVEAPQPEPPAPVVTSAPARPAPTGGGGSPRTPVRPVEPAPVPGPEFQVQSAAPPAQLDTLALARARSAAAVEALPAPEDPRPWENPVILAALLIALVGVQQGRTWILRRTGVRTPPDEGG